jgi:hypothetical protein
MLIMFFNLHHLHRMCINLLIILYYIYIIHLSLFDTFKLVFYLGGLIILVLFYYIWLIYDVLDYGMIVYNYLWFVLCS